MVATLTATPAEPEPAPPRRIRRKHVGVAVAIVVVVAMVAGTASWWYLGGARLRPAGGVGYGGVAVVGRPLSFGLVLNSSNGAVTLISAKPTSLSGRAAVGFAITGALGSADGDLAAQGYRPRAVRGARVDGKGPGDAVFLAMTLTAPRAGLVEVRGIDVEYRSGLRTRTAHADVSACVLAVNPADVKRVLAETDRRSTGDPDLTGNDMISQYLNCESR